MDRAIIHVNVADFAVAVERAVDRRLSGRPVIVAPEGALRAAVYDMSEEAYRCGVRKEMPLARARRLCRDARVVPPHPARYEQAMRTLLAQAVPFSPRIEAGETDGHLFIDATGTGRLFGPPADVAARLRRQVRGVIGLEPVWSVAPNKLVAKVATRLVKPDGEAVVRPGDEGTFLAPVPLHLLPGVERADLARLREFNLARAGEVAVLQLEELQVPFGGRAMALYEAVRGIDPSPVLPVGERPPRAAADHEFGTDTNDAAELECALYGLVERVGAELRLGRRAARRVAVTLDYSDGARCARQAAARPATANDIALFEVARPVLALAWARRVRVRRVRLACDRLVFPPAQMELFSTDATACDRRERVVGALDAVRRRFGGDALQVGRTLGEGASPQRRRGRRG
jgi:DNA polymerase-4